MFVNSAGDIKTKEIITNEPRRFLKMPFSKLVLQVKLANKK